MPFCAYVKPSEVEGIYACGGGAYNKFLLEQIAKIVVLRFARLRIRIDVDQLETIAFACLQNGGLKNCLPIMKV